MHKFPKIFNMSIENGRVSIGVHGRAAVAYSLSVRSRATGLVKSNDIY